MALPDLSLIYKTVHWHQNNNSHAGEVGLFVLLPSSESNKFPDAGRHGHDESPPHITVVYLGSVPKELEAKLKRVVQSVCERTNPFQVTYGKVAKFETDKGDKVYHTPVKSSRLVKFHDELKKELQRNQLPVNTKFPEYKPHITIEYVAAGTEPKFIEQNFVGGFTVDSVWIWGSSNPQMIYLGNN
jgi:2'-5' RNA ligase